MSGTSFYAATAVLALGMAFTIKPAAEEGAEIVSRLSWINVWPSTGQPDQPWLDEPDEDAFTCSSRSVCELYTEAVRDAGLPGQHAELRLFCSHEDDRDDMFLEMHTDAM
ncbi:hypothetical protein [Paractinoplanes toevensis]|uniref:Uncharacterized protein n=1 Tax=Paractinoplanes toevensis TaxID=571911 RepID=A0A919WB47_9ACTN|nr:hypothetical protein [Actinoplanes toevensis]GIM96857.1 hypothetical protein Ato02nite_086500 [Actinoplanes toevensis]